MICIQVAKTILLQLPQEMIADFETCFSKKEDERSYLYQNATKTINEGTGDVFVKKTLNLKLIKNNKPVIELSTLDEVNFNSVELESNPEWRAKDIAGELCPFEYVMGASFWEKISNWIRLSSILNEKFNDSVLENNQKLLSDLKSDVNSDSNTIKEKEKEIIAIEKNIIEFKNEECIESYTHGLFVEIIINKIKTEEQLRLDKEFEELNKPKLEKPQVVN